MIYSVDIYEPVHSVVSADTTGYSADETEWPTADGGLLAGAQDYTDAEVVSATGIGEGGGGIVEPPPWRLVVSGNGYAVLPKIDGEAHGIVIAQATVAAALPVFEARGTAVTIIAVDGAVLFKAIGGLATGDYGQSGDAGGVVKGFAASSYGANGIAGEGHSLIAKFNAAAVGQPDDEEAAMLAILLAA